jgi:hypothetical protein
MADRYWRGGSGSWNTTTNWSTTSGGGGGASVPTAADNVFFDTNSGSGTAHYIVTVTDNSTCANLTFSPETAVGVTQFVVSNGFVIAGTFSTTSTAGNRRLWIQSSTYGLMRDMQIAAIGSVSDVDFRDIRVTGAGGTLSGTRIGDLRGNSNITFSTPKTVYWTTSTGSNFAGNNWAATIGGAASTDNFPLAQDIAAFPNTGLSVGSTAALDGVIPYTGSVDMSARTNAMTLNIGAITSVYGDWKNSSATTIGGGFELIFSGRKTQTLTSAGKSFGAITVDSYGGSLELADAVTATSVAITVANGTFDTNGYAVTAGQLSSNNTNIRTINLRNSTVTLSSSTIVSLFGSPNLLTFNAGTSQINSSVSAAVNLQSGGNTFYNVSLNLTSAGTHNISGENTFNNLSVTAPSSAGLTQLSLLANQTINGTLTVAGASPVRRIFLRSDTLGTQRDLTVGTLAATDCDFRDIDILGAAAGSTPTRAGDCGGNAGITFPSPKTVYWNQSNTNNWSATVWAAASNGTPDINNFPLAQDTAVIDNSSGTSLGVTINAAWNIGTFDASGRTTAVTFTVGTTLPLVHGNWLFGTGVTQTSTTGTITFSGRGTQTITSNGVSFGCNVSIDSVTGTTQLADAFTTISVRRLAVRTGTFDAVTYNVTTGQVGLTFFSGPRTLKMGSGTWTVSGTGNIWGDGGFNTGSFTFYKGTANIVLSDTSTSARTFNGGSLSYNKLTIGGATGTSTTTITDNNQFTELASTKTVAHTIALATTAQTFGAWTVRGTVGNVVTVTGTGTSHVIAGARVSGVDYLAMGNIGFAATSPGEFYAGANSTGFNATIIKTAAPAAVTRYWRGGTGTWDATTTTNWSATSGGAGGASVPTSADAVVFNSASNAAAYTVTSNATFLRCGSLTISGPASGIVTWAGTASMAAHGSITLPATGLTRTYSGLITLSGSGNATLTTNGVALNQDLTLNGVGSNWTLGSAVTLGVNNNFVLSNGTFNTAGYSLLLNRFFVSPTASSSILNLGASTITESSQGFTISGNNTNFILNAGTSTINNNSSSGFIANQSSNVLNFYNYNFTNGASSISGKNTFNNLSFAGRTTPGITNIAIDSNQVIYNTLTFSAGTNATMRTYVRTNALSGEIQTLTCAAFSATDTDFADIAFAGAAAPVSGIRLGDRKNTSGIIFDAPKTVYWNSVGSNNWGNGTSSWALTQGGVSTHDAFPLAQDTAVIDNSKLASGSTITLNAGYPIGTIDMSARTTNTMTLATGTNTPYIYGNWINGTGTTLTGAGRMTFAGRNTQTITSAGRTFTQSFSIDSANGSVVLQDAFITNSVNNFELFTGTINANGYNLTLSGSGAAFAAGGALTKTVAIGSGTWTVSGSTWSTNPSTKITVTGTGTISLTSASAKTFAGGGISYSGITLNQGGAGTLTISGNNTFANITNTYKATGATTIALGTTTQRVGAFGASGEAGRVLTVTGTSATSPATLVFTGSGQATTPSTDYLTITGVRAYSLDTTWYAGNNSTNNGSLGWYFVAGGGGAVTAFIIESSIAADSISGFAAFNTNASETTTSADSLSSQALFGVGISETITASEAQAAGLICLGTLSETATAADVAAAFQAYLGAVAESTTATDLIAASLTLNAAISELITGSEQIATTLSSSASVSELISAADSLTGGLLFLSNISEATTAQEVAAASIIFNRAVSEATTAAEVLVAVAAFNAVVPETVSGSDVAQALLTVGGSISESLAAVDALSSTRTLSSVVSESVVAEESQRYGSLFLLTILEAASPSDSAVVAPSAYSAVALASAQASESVRPAASVYSRSLLESAVATTALRRSKVNAVSIITYTETAADVYADTLQAQLVQSNVTTVTVNSGQIFAEVLSVTTSVRRT